MHAIAGLNSPICFRISSVRLLAPLAVLAAALCWTQMTPAQAAASTAHTSTAHKAAHRHKHAVKSPAHPIVPEAAALPAAPPAPVMPLWPANEKPVDASVTWDSKGLRISAANSSLHQILRDVATVTGATVEGIEADQRIFGIYGPGKARDVLSQLLHGTSYNVLMIGEQGEGTPREIILSSRSRAAGGTAVAVNPAPKSDDDDADVDDQPQQPQQQMPPPMRPGFGPHGRTPLEVQQEMQRRQQQGQPQPPNNPQN